jgi:hypothetical protein
MKALDPYWIRIRIWKNEYGSTTLYRAVSGVNISEDARHWIGLLQCNPSADAAMTLASGQKHIRERTYFKIVCYMCATVQRCAAECRQQSIPFGTSPWTCPLCRLSCRAPCPRVYPSRYLYYVPVDGTVITAYR